MLIEIVGFDVKLDAMTVHLSRDNPGAKADRGRKFKLRIAAALNIQSYFVRRSTVVVEAKSRLRGANIVDRKRAPIGRHMWSKNNPVVRSFSFESQQSSQHGTDHHRRRPNLVRRTGGERLVVVARKDFRYMAKRTVKCQQSVRAKVCISRKCTMVAVFTDRSPPGKQRPHRSVMVSSGVVAARMRRNDSHSPVG